MNWTTATPGMSGFYWWRELGKRSPQVVQVDIWDPQLSTVAFFGIIATTPLHELNEGEWAGPLEPPA